MNEVTTAILEENILGVLATVNEDGSPRATPLHVVADNEAVYWFSHNDRVHSQNIQRDARVSVAVFSPDESQGPKGVYINGRAEVLSAEGRMLAYDVFQQRLGEVPAVFETADAYKVPLGVLDERKSTGNCWYFYS